MSTLVLLRGLPAAGKTIHSLGLVKQGYKRVNADDLRLLIDNGSYSKSNEKYITEVMQTIVTLGLQSGFNVVMDNTNLNPYWISWAKTLCQDLRCKLEIIDIDTPLDVCIQRDLNRTTGRVGKDVIMKLYNKYFIGGAFPKTYRSTEEILQELTDLTQEMGLY